MRIEDRTHKDAGVERDGFARFQVDFAARFGFDRFQEFHQIVALIIGAGNMVATAEIQPRQLREIRLQMRLDRRPGFAQRGEILFAQAVKVDAVHAFQMLGPQLVDRKAQARMRRTGVIPRHFAGGVQRIDAQADIEAVAAFACGGQFIGEARDLAGGIENHVVRYAQDFGQVFRLVCRAIRRDFAGVVLVGQFGFPQARRAHAIQMPRDQRGHAPHAERFQRGKQPDPAAIADVGEHAQVSPQRRRIDDERGAVDPRKIEMGECARIASPGFHDYDSSIRTRAARRVP